MKTKLSGWDYPNNSCQFPVWVANVHVQSICWSDVFDILKLTCIVELHVCFGGIYYIRPQCVHVFKIKFIGSHWNCLQVTRSTNVTQDISHIKEPHGIYYIKNTTVHFI